MPKFDISNDLSAVAKIAVVQGLSYSDFCKVAVLKATNEPPFGSNTKQGSLHQWARRTLWPSLERSFANHLAGEDNKWKPLSRKESDPLDLLLQDPDGIIRALTDQEFEQQSVRFTMAKQGRGRSLTPTKVKATPSKSVAST